MAEPRKKPAPAKKYERDAQAIFESAFRPDGGEDEALPGSASDGAIARAKAARVGRNTYPRELVEPWEFNPRKSRTSAQILQMARSLKEHGQIDPIQVRPHPDLAKRTRGVVQILGGQTRWLAAAPDLADIGQLWIELNDIPNDGLALDFAWRQNHERNELSVLDDALYFITRLKMDGGTENETSLRQLARVSGVGKDRISQLVRLLTLPDEIQKAFLPSDTEADDDTKRVHLNEKHGRGLLKLSPYPDEQHRLFLEIKLNQLSGNAAVARADVLFDQAEQDAGKPPKPKKTRISSGALGGNEASIGGSLGATQTESAVVISVSAPTTMEDPGAEAGAAPFLDLGESQPPASERAGDAADAVQETKQMAQRLEFWLERLAQLDSDPFLLGELDRALTDLSNKMFGLQDWLDQDATRSGAGK